MEKHNQQKTNYNNTKKNYNKNNKIKNKHTYKNKKLQNSMCHAKINSKTNKNNKI